MVCSNVLHIHFSPCLKCTLSAARTAYFSNLASIPGNNPRFLFDEVTKHPQNASANSSSFNADDVLKCFTNKIDLIRDYAPIRIMPMELQ